MGKDIIATIYNPRHGRDYEHKFGSARALDTYLSKPQHVHLECKGFRDKTEADKLPYTLK
ncbi:hypothetical protein J1TS5_25440 [Paenibacillus macerans]|nr:hypothetical protein J1TS5_25440 [Paenibacillus macerans]